MPVRYPTRRGVILAAALLSSAGSVATAAESAPLRVVKGFYRRNFNQEKMPLSVRLASLYRAAQAESRRRDEPVSGLDFAWTIGAQDSEEGFERTLQFVEKPLGSARSQITVTFRNGGPQRIVYSLVSEGGRWRVDDIAYSGDGAGTLSAMLERGARGE